MARIDPRLEWMMEDSTDPSDTFPFLMKIREHFDAKDITGLTITSKLGDIYACRATREAIEKLRTDRRVISTEASH
ncbi:MAG: hypothetical protein K2X29_04285 [Candidatus Obscuribacterales bacterium]|nr:hypothetical protein [Candidatus Obscuribacterales bacterium]